MKGLVLYVASILAGVLRVAHAENIEYKQLLEGVWMWRLRSSPEFASSIGNHSYSSQLEHFTEEAFYHKKKESDYFLSRIRNLNSTNLGREELLHLDILKYELKCIVEGYKWRTFSIYNPINNLEGIHMDFTLWMDSTLLETVQDIHIYKQRLTALSTQVREHIRLMRQAIRLGRTYHKESVKDVPAIIESFTDLQPLETPFCKLLQESLSTMTLHQEQRNNLTKEVENIVENYVLPAYKKLHRFIVGEYIPNTRPLPGISSIEGGEQFYRACLQWYIDFDVSPFTIYNAALHKTKQILKRISEIKDVLAYRSNTYDFIKFTQGASRYFYKTENELLDAYKDVIFRQIPIDIHRVLYNYSQPEIILEAMSFPGPRAIIMPGSEDGTIPASFFINVENPFNQPKWKILDTVLKQIAPGGLYQITLNRRNDLPYFRRYIENRKMFSVPFQIPSYTAYKEGWALYASSLMLDIRPDYTMYDEYGYLYSELYHYTLQVVDIGIHLLRWSEELAIQVIRERTGVSSLVAMELVSRIVTYPAHAQAAPFASDLIKQLRSKTNQTFGGAFDIREFHRRILSPGPVPLTILVSEIQKWREGAKPTLSCSSIDSGHMYLLLVIMISYLLHISIY